MKSSVLLKVVVAIAGLMFTGVGIATMMAPVAVLSRNGVDIAGNIALLNDVRGSGGVLIGCSLLILSGVFVRALTFTATLIAGVVYTLFAIARGLSIAMDGMPVDSLVKATVVELIVGVVCLVLLFRFREKPEA